MLKSTLSPITTLPSCPKVIVPITVASSIVNLPTTSILPFKVFPPLITLSLVIEISSVSSLTKTISEQVTSLIDVNPSLFSTSSETTLSVGTYLSHASWLSEFKTG